MDKLKKFADLFWQGALKAIEFIGLLFLACVALALCAAVLLGVVISGVLVWEAIGFIGCLIYSLDWVLVFLFIDALFKSKKFKGKAYARILKRFGAVILFMMALMFINLVLWVIGYALLFVFGVTLSIGATILVGFGCVVIALLMWLLVQHIKREGWTKLLETIVYASGALVILAVIVLVVWAIVF